MAADTTTTAPRGQNTVTVACRYPSGMILELDDELSADEAQEANTAQNGIMGRRKFFPSGKRVVLNGANAAHELSPQKGRVYTGFGITEVSVDFWEAWSKQHKGFPPLVNGTIFALASNSAAREEALNRKDVLTGQEPLNPRKPAPGIMPDMPVKSA